MHDFLLPLWLLGMVTNSVLCDTTCLKREDLGNAPGNVYYCTDEAKPECCETDSEFTCCESNESKTWREQAQLWGTVAAVVILIGVAFVCCRYDHSFCNSEDRTLAQRFGLRKAPDPPLTNLDLPSGKDDVFANSKNSNSRIAGLPPLPPARAGWGNHHDDDYGDDDDTHGSHPPSSCHNHSTGRRGSHYKSGYRNDEEGEYFF